MRVLAALLVVSSTLLVACGGAKTKTVVKTVASAPSTESETTGTVTATNPTDNSCQAMGITATKLQTGTCIASDGARLTVVNKDGLLKMKTLTARLRGVRYAQSVSDSTGAASARSHAGQLVIVSLTVTNRLDTPQDFAPSGVQQAWLVAGHGRSKTFNEYFDAENEADQQSFISQGDNQIQPGESRTGDVVFDVPLQYSKGLETSQNEGVVNLANLGDDLSQTKDVGLIRLYH